MKKIFHVSMKWLVGVGEKEKTVRVVATSGRSKVHGTGRRIHLFHLYPRYGTKTRTRSTSFGLQIQSAFSRKHQDYRLVPCFGMVKAI